MCIRAGRFWLFSLDFNGGKLFFCIGVRWSRKSNRKKNQKIFRGGASRSKSTFSKFSFFLFVISNFEIWNIFHKFSIHVCNAHDFFQNYWNTSYNLDSCHKAQNRVWLLYKEILKIRKNWFIPLILHKIYRRGSNPMLWGALITNIKTKKILKNI